VNIITRADFEKLQKPLNGVFGFTFGEGCGLCNIYYEKLKEQGCDWTIVDLGFDDEKWAFTEMLITGFPSTKIIIDDMTVYNKGGVLFSKQIKEANLKYKELNGD